MNWENMVNPVESGVYLTVMDWHFVVLEFNIFANNECEWWYPGNPIDISNKYGKHPSKWIKLPE